MLKQAFADHWPDAPMKHLVGGQVELESNWNYKAHLHTNREDGYGLVEITITKTFNTFKDAIQIDALKNWDWNKDKYNPTNQLIFIVNQDRTHFNRWRKYAANDTEAWKMACVSYNAGESRVLHRRQVAAIKGLPKDRWTGGLENAHDSSEDKVLYGSKLWVSINSYPIIVFKRAEKYRGLFDE